MKGTLFTILSLLLFVSFLVQAQDHAVKEKHKVLVDDNKSAEQVKIEVTPTKVTNGDDIGVTTTYDYFSNSIIRDQILYDKTNDVVHLANMIRPGPVSGGTVREVVHTFGNTGSWTNQSVIGAQSGWPQVDQNLTGSAVGTVAIVFHTPSRLAIWDGATGYIVSQFDPSSDPSLQWSGDNIFLASSGDRIQFQFYLTTDFGTTFTNWDSISSYSPLPIYWTTNGGVEVGMSKSPDEQILVMFGTNVGAGHNFDGISVDSCDNFWILSSMDAGASWTGTMIGADGVENLVSGYPTDNYAPLFENFGQVDLAVGNDGVMHAIANGYGLTFDAGGVQGPDRYPVLYWNSSSNEWVSISDFAIDTIQAIGDYYPTNCLGQSYPSISVSENGQVLFAMWTGPQLSAPGVLDLGDNGAGTMYFWRDLYFAYSTDFGATWTYGGTLPGMSNTLSETFGHAAQLLEQVDATTYRAHIIYLADQTTGIEPFDFIATDNELVYTTYDITASSVDENSVPNAYNLEQNYPNPFNPSTTISYSLAERSDVSLKVYDVLGNEVASLVNTTQEAGKHSINFDASKLASGLYIYKLNANNFTSSKKMMLVK